MRDFQGGWSGLKDYAVECGVVTVDDSDDAVAAKIRAVIQGTLPEEDVAEVAGDGSGGPEPGKAADPTLSASVDVPPIG